jgi:hypothetical protein
MEEALYGIFFFARKERRVFFCLCMDMNVVCIKQFSYEDGISISTLQSIKPKPGPQRLSLVTWT